MKWSKEERERFAEENMGLYYWQIKSLCRLYPKIEREEICEMVGEAFVLAMNYFEQEKYRDYRFSTLFTKCLKAQVDHRFAYSSRKKRTGKELIHYQGVKSTDFNGGYEEVGHYLDVLTGNIIEEKDVGVAEKEWVDWCFSHLSQNERHVIEQHVIMNRTFNDIGEEMGVSKQRVHQLYSRGIKKIKEREENERTYCGV